MQSFQLLHRRRALFPQTGDESDGELGYMCPINSETDTDSDEQVSVDPRNLDDYIILDALDKHNANCTPSNTKPLHKNVNSSAKDPESLCVSLTDSSNITSATPLKESPSDKLKTPHDSCNVNTKAPKLMRKSLLDSSFVNMENIKRKFNSPEDSPSHKISKLDMSITKPSKVRTALFPETSKTFPSNIFYPQNKTSQPAEPLSYSCDNKRTNKKSSGVYLCKRKRGKNQFGLINAGVRHKIRRPNRKIILKKPKSDQNMKCDLEILNEAPLRDYLEELENMNNKKKQMSEIITKPVTVCDNSKKRDHSPVPDEKRKFFKSTHSSTNENTQTKTNENSADKNVKLNAYDFDASDLTVPEDNPLEITNIDSLLEALDNDKENLIVLKAHNSISASENSILLHDTPVEKRAELMLSPISQMCDTTSGLALNSPKKVKNLSDIIQNMPNSQKVFNNICSLSDKTEDRLFPVFYMNHSTQRTEKMEHNSILNHNKKWKGLAMNQMLLDVGQKNFGATECPECGIVYSKGEPNDEMNHQNYHEAKQVLRFNGWKNERVVTDLHSLGKIIKVVPGDPKIWWKKIAELQDVINRELGYYDMPVKLDNTQVFLYIQNKNIVGCLVTEPGKTAYKMLSELNDIDLCSEESYPIKCIVQRIWVSWKHRKQGIATALMDSARRNFMMGYILDSEDIAMSSPTELGKLFAARYFKTPNFLVYT